MRRLAAGREPPGLKRRQDSGELWRGSLAIQFDLPSLDLMMVGNSSCAYLIILVLSLPTLQWGTEQGKGERICFLSSGYREMFNNSIERPVA
jgi:hypothetical protein